MNSVEESIRIERPVKVVYDQWTQFEDFPHFMEGVKEVRQIDDSHLHWEVEMGGFIKTWELKSSSRCRINLSPGKAPTAPAAVVG